MPTTGTDAPEAHEASAAAAGAPVKRSYVQRMFSEIAPRYDLLNQVLSAGVDRRWRRAALDRLEWTRRPDGTYLDLCAGTLDIGAALARERGFRGRVVGADFAEPMLRAGMAKGPTGALSPVVADALALPLADGACDGAIVAFGIRNVSHLEAALAEVRRVLVPGARFVILELSTPRSAVVRAVYHSYFHHVLPRVGALVSGHPTAYRYLCESVQHFPEREELARRMGAAGFTHVSWSALTLGIAAIHVGQA